MQVVGVVAVVVAVNRFSTVPELGAPRVALRAAVKEWGPRASEKPSTSCSSAGTGLACA